MVGLLVGPRIVNWSVVGDPLVHSPCQDRCRPYIDRPYIDRKKTYAICVYICFGEVVGQWRGPNGQLLSKPREANSPVAIGANGLGMRGQAAGMMQQMPQAFRPGAREAINLQ